MSISIICPKCETKLKAATASAGKTAPCPKCKSTLIIETPEEPLLTIDESPEPQIYGKSITKAPIKNVAANKKGKRITCDGYDLSYDSKIFSVKGPKGELRFPLRTQMAIIYTHKGDPLRIFIRVFILCWLPAVSMFCFGLGGKVGDDPSYIAGFLIFAIILMGMIYILVRDFTVHGLYTKGPLVVGIRIGGAAYKFVFKKDRDIARSFFEEVESLANK